MCWRMRPDPLTFSQAIGYNMACWGVAIIGARWRFIADYEPHPIRAWYCTRDEAHEATP